MGEEGAPSSPPPPTGVFHQHTDQPFRCCKLVIPENPLAGQGGGTPVSCVAPPPPPRGVGIGPPPGFPQDWGHWLNWGGGGALCVSLSPSPVGTGPPPLPWSSPHRVSRGVLGPARPPVWGVLVTSLGLGLGLGRGGGGGKGGCAPAQGGRAHACPRPALSRSPRSDWSGANLYANLPAGGEGRGLETEVGGV